MRKRGRAWKKKHLKIIIIIVMIFVLFVLRISRFKFKSKIFFHSHVKRARAQKKIFFFYIKRFPCLTFYILIFYTHTY